MYKFIISFSKTKKRRVYKETPSQFNYFGNDLKRICVYEHYYDNESLPFYVGQGSISRAYCFNQYCRNKSWLNKVKDISKVHVKIIYIDISIEQSIIYEKELIKKYGKLIDNTGCLTNENDGGKNSQIGENNYFYKKRFFKEENSNYGNKYYLNPNSIPILQIDIFGNIIKEWSSAQEAEEIGHFCSGPIGYCCKGKRYIHKGYQWIYKKDYNSNKNYEYIPSITNKGLYIGFPINHIDDISKILIIYSPKEAKELGFSIKNISQVCNGEKKSHKGYVFRNYYYLPIEEKLKYKDLIDATKI